LNGNTTYIGCNKIAPKPRIKTGRICQIEVGRKISSTQSVEGFITYEVVGRESRGPWRCLYSGVHSDFLILDRNALKLGVGSL
jgi:hypothetical protein